jgi:hypothetical protein
MNISQIVLDCKCDNNIVRLPNYQLNREDYKSAIFLPVENFVTRRKNMYKQFSKQTVWGENN